MRVFLLFTLLIIPLPAITDTYRSVDADGRTTFSDQQKTPDAEKINVGKPHKIQSIDTGSLNPSKPGPKPKANRYTNLKIVSPSDGQVHRDNAGNITVSAQVTPGLRGSDKFVLYLDGNKVQSGSSPQFNLQNIDRGTHSVSIAIVDASGKSLLSSAAISFSLLRATAKRR